MVSYPYEEWIQLVGNKIKGRLVVQEWLNGTVQHEPIMNPKLVIKDTNKNVIAEATMRKEIPYLYSYEIDISNIQEKENYTIEVIGTNPNNISTHQNIQIMYNNQDISIINDNILIIKDGKLILNNI